LAALTAQTQEAAAYAHHNRYYVNSSGHVVHWASYGEEKSFRHTAECRGGIECPRCDRAGSYRRDGLMARFGISPCPICSLPWRRAPGGETFLTPAARSSRILTSRTAGDQWMADDPNRRVKAARDAMNKTVVSRLKFGRLDSPRAGRWGLLCLAKSRRA
jgi:hypothetical protein